MSNSRPFRIVALALFVLTIAASPRVRAQTATDALGALWNTICATATDGTLLFSRCDETLNSPDPLANAIAATGQHLTELPGQTRIGSGSQGQAPGAMQVSLNGLGRISLQQDPSGGLGLSLAGDELGHGWSLFASADVGRQNHDASAFEAGFDARSTALTVGADWRASRDWVFGFALDHRRQKLDYADTAGRIDTRFNGLTGFASRSWGDHWSLDAYAGVARGRYDLVRGIRYSIAVPAGIASIATTAQASPSVRRNLGGLALNWNTSHEAWEFDASAGLDGSSTAISGYRESGGLGLALNVGRRSTLSRIGRLDLGVARTVSEKWGVWRPQLQLGWKHAISDSARRTTISLAEDPLQYAVSFDAEADDRSWGEFSLGSVFVLSGGQSGFIQYRQRFANAYLDERVLSLGWRIELP